MNKHDRKPSDNWFNYQRYQHVHESVLNTYSGHFLSNSFYTIPISTTTKLQLEVDIELINGFKVSIQKGADVKIIDDEVMCQTSWYKYLARHPHTKYQIRYCSPHFGENQEKEDWDYYHHRHLIQYEGKMKSESVIIYSPFDTPVKHQINKTYITSNDNKRYSFKKDPWPQIEDFLKEITELN
jgi:hypothetical protein